MGEVVIGKRLSLDFIPRLAKCLFSDLEELRIPTISFQIQLEVGDRRIRNAISQPALKLADGGGVNVFVVPSNAANVEDDRNRVDLLTQTMPSVLQLFRLG